MPPQIGGQSLLPALQGASGGPGEVIGEYLAEGAIAPVVMIRRDRYKFVHSPVDPDQLYDLAADPDERVNLAAHPAHAQKTTEFRAEVARRWQLPALHDAVVASQRQRHFVYPAPLRAGTLSALGLSADSRREPPVYPQRPGTQRSRSHGAVSPPGRRPPTEYVRTCTTGLRRDQPDSRRPHRHPSPEAT